MPTPTTPEAILAQIAAIPALEQGKLCLLRHGPNGPYYNLQRWENGANISQYVPADQLPAVEANVAAYAQFQELIACYVQLVSTRSREARLSGEKKTPRPPASVSRKKPRSRRS